VREGTADEQREAQTVADSTATPSTSRGGDAATTGGAIQVMLCQECAEKSSADPVCYRL